MKILLSVKPEFAEQIFSGQKKFEYRKVIFRDKKVKDVVVYVTKPVGKIIGEFKIKKILFDTPETIWNRTKQYSGINQKYFNEYFKNRTNAYAIQIDSYSLYKESIDPFDEYKRFVAPQSFRYIRNCV